MLDESVSNLSYISACSVPTRGRVVDRTWNLSSISLYNRFVFWVMAYPLKKASVPMFVYN